MIHNPTNKTALFAFSKKADFVKLKNQRTDKASSNFRLLSALTVKGCIMILDLGPNLYPTDSIKAPRQTRDPQISKLETFPSD